MVRSEVGPDLLRGLHDERELLPHVVLGDPVPLGVGREAALRADADSGVVFSIKKLCKEARLIVYSLA